MNAYLKDPIFKELLDALGYGLMKELSDDDKVPGGDDLAERRPFNWPRAETGE